MKGDLLFMKDITSSDYNRYLSAIKAANETRDKDALLQIQKQLISIYGLDNNDVEYLLRQFFFSV